MGEQEVLGLLPVTRDEPVNEWAEHLSEEEKKRTEGQSEPRQEEHIDLSGRNKIQSINNWRIANGCGPVDEAAVRKAAVSTTNIVEKNWIPLREDQRYHPREPQPFHRRQCFRRRGNLFQNHRAGQVPPPALSGIC